VTSIRGVADQMGQRKSPMAAKGSIGVEHGVGIGIEGERKMSHGHGGRLYGVQG
jgi:hypothetical protein